MKRLLAILTAIAICAGILCIPAAAATSASLTGPGEVRAGDTITVTFKLSGSGIYGIEGKLAYDSSQVTLSSTKQKISSPWVVEFNGDNFVAYDNNLSKPITKTTTIFTAKFKVSSKVSAGDTIKISCANVTASDGSKDAKVGTVTYSKKVSAPLSTVNTLKSLSVSNATISPEFDSGTTEYTASVPFEVSKLDISAKAKDSKAKVSIDNPELKVNGTTQVTITVKAESGKEKVYTISVTRAQDPNYVPGSNANLSGITVEGFLLSPVFTPENTEYVIWLPYETETVAITGTAEDPLGSSLTEGGEALLPGQDNEIRVIGVAEDGTQKVYTVIAKRAAEHGAEETVPETEPETVPETTEALATVPETTEASMLTVLMDNDTMILAAALAAVLILTLGIVIGLVIGRASRKKSTHEVDF